MRKIIGFLVLAVAIAGLSGSPERSLQAASLYSIRSGNWSDPSIWSSRAAPGSGDSVTITTGHTVTYDVVSDVVLGAISIDGTLKFSRVRDTRLRTNNNLQVRAGGYLDMGTQADFIPKARKAEIFFVLSQAQADAYVGGSLFQPSDKGLWVDMDGRWEVHGSPLLRTWSKLAQAAPAGATEVVVENDVTDWYIGGNVVLSSTTMPRSYSWSERLGKEVSKVILPEHEVRLVQALELLADGKTRITLNEPLRFTHEGTDPFQGEVALLTRNILFKTELLGADETSFINDVRTREFAHTMQQHGSAGNIQYAEFKYMGHYGTLGRYPIHPHETLEAPKGMIYRGNGIWYPGFRCINLHATHGVLVEDNVCYSASSTAYFVEALEGAATRGNADNVFVHNLAIGTKAKHWNDRNDDSIAGEAGRVASFWPGEGTVNEAFLGNVSADVEAARGASGGFHFPEGGMGRPEKGTIPFTFVSNEAHTGGDHGIHGWQNGSPPRDMVDTRLWRNGENGVRWGAYNDPLKFYNARLLENGKHGVEAISIRTFLQDSIITGSPRADSSTDQGGFAIAHYVAAQPPNHPVWIARNTFKNLPATQISQNHDRCEKEITPNINVRPVIPGCSATYAIVMGNKFENTNRPMDFGWQANPNSWWKVFDYTGPGGLPQNFVVVRKDLSDPSNRGVITEKLVNRRSFYAADFDALITPMDSLPTNIEFTGLLNDRDLDKQSTGRSPDFTFSTVPDYPPEITLRIAVSGQTARLTANAIDDQRVTRVEFLVDWEVVETLNAPNAGAAYQTTVDLSGYPRKYAYLYARTFDGTVQLKDYQQRAYSNVFEIGPEVILAGQPLPPGP